MTISPNLAVGSDWRGTLNKAFSILRRIVFVDEQTFSWGDFDPQINWGGMAVTLEHIRRARFIKIWKLLFISFHVDATLGAPLTDRVIITIPGTLTGDINSFQDIPVTAYDAGALEIGTATGMGTSNNIVFYRPGYAAHNAGAFTVRFNAILEVI